MTRKTELFDESAERAVLGALLINPTAIVDVAETLTGKDFRFEKYGWIYDAMLSLWQEGKPVDFLTVVDQLEKQGHMAKGLTPLVVAQLSNEVPSALNVTAYADIVGEFSLRRGIMEAATAIANAAYDMENLPKELIALSEKRIFDAVSKRDAKEVVSVAQVTKEAAELLEDRKKHGASGIPTNLASLNKVLGGFQDGDFVLIAGRPSMGKTGLLLQQTLFAAQMLKKRVLVFSLEMPRHQVVERLLVQINYQSKGKKAPFTMTQLRDGTMTNGQTAAYWEANKELADMPISICDQSIVSPTEILSRCRRVKAESGLDLVVIDYFQLLDTNVKFTNPVHMYSHLSKRLKQIARELNVPVLCASQLSRNVEHRQDKRPILSDLRETGGLEQDADVVLFIYRDEYYYRETESLGTAEIILAKHRNGPIGNVTTRFKQNSVVFEELTRRWTQP